MYIINSSGFLIGEYNRPYFTLLHTLTCGLVIFWVSYKKQNADEGRYAYFFASLLQAILLSVALGIILIALGFLGFFAVEQLFDLSSRDYTKIYPIYAVFVFGFFAPLYALAHFPRYDALPQGQYEHSPQALFVNKYILVPFVTVYFVILYAYSVKVLLSFGEWPRGIISYLVMIFSLIAYLVYMTTRNLEHIRFIAVFRKYLPFAVFFQTFMLFYAIWLRIDQYGLTTHRYIVVLVGMILFTLSLYFIASKYKRIVMIPLLLSIVSVFVSLGPWGIFQLPYTLQTNRLIAAMKAADMYDGTNIVPFDAEKHSQGLRNVINGSLDYVCSYDNDCQAVKALFAADMQEMVKGYDGRSEPLREKSSGFIRDHIKKKYHIAYQNIDIPEGWVPEIRSWNFSAYSGKQYDRIEDVRGYDYTGIFSARDGFYMAASGTTATFSLRGDAPVILGTYDFGDTLTRLIEKHPFRIEKEMRAYDEEHFRYHFQYEQVDAITFTFENEDFFVSGSIDDIQVEQDRSGNITIQNASGKIRIRDKSGKIAL